MEQKKILTDIERRFLRVKRKECGYSAENVSIEMGKSKAWLGQIERGKLKTITMEDYKKLEKIYSNINEEVKLEAIIYKHGYDDVAIWWLDLPQEALEQIEAILDEYRHRGCSLRGTTRDIADEILDM